VARCLEHFGSSHVLSGAMVGKMRKITEYREHAVECRKMAVEARGAVRKEQLEGMALAWEQLADMRKMQVERRLTPRLIDAILAQYQKESSSACFC
jgi:hypothetical protein